MMSQTEATPQESGHESRLIDRARKGDQKAFRSLYEFHVGPLFRFLLQFASDRDEARDWVQRAFIRAFEHLGQFDRRSLFGTWLFTIGLNEMRTDRRRKNIIDLEPDLSSLADGSSESTEEFVWSSAMRHWLDMLDTQKRSVFVLHEIEGFSHKEIAAMLHIEESHSRTILTRVRSYLQRRWTGERKAL
jgi:RNA polymerase sigma-70 factor (ECF subfamily)